ncbi:adenylate/guanylate cyclase domain-containing protein [Exilibacterium tricleocarpae]|uniref:Adenylate/guanylate cyclase domain-containing protein n=1 Tax=Exilibacterium tricleocarpae TaxID=2591008 RepID=A0A545U884_9GAMM|nr:adenylate/guanylate cyclase domain-containing protein [Exilibacterium tricleocarpae]TQV85676.1 adenylate/guanylate cyclase domain-containing protein [Exilibacterium tricleocarpae]
MSDTSQLQAIMFADVSGSSALYKRVGNLEAKSLIDETIGTMRALTEANNGIVVKTIGDEVMARFDHPEAACSAAIAMQQGSQDGNGLAIRIGLAYGATLLVDGDVFGDTVNDAACVAHIARARQTVVTQAIVDELPPSLRDACQEFDRIPIKGEGQISLIYRLQWELPDQTYSATRVMALQELSGDNPASQRLTLAHSDGELQLTPQETPFVIGRDPRRVDLFINTSLASRDHCHIDFRRGKFVLVDHSTNGTYVTTPGHEPIYLRREEVPLQGEGSIGIGGQTDKPSTEVIRFRLS